MQHDWFMYHLRSTYKNRPDFPFNWATKPSLIRNFALHAREVRYVHIIFCTPSFRKSWTCPRKSYFSLSRSLFQEHWTSSPSFFTRYFFHFALGWIPPWSAPFPRIMPRSHLHVKPSHKSHDRGFSRNGDGRGYLVAVMGSTWQLRDVCGRYGVYANLPVRASSRRPHNSQVEPVIATPTVVLDLKLIWN